MKLAIIFSICGGFIIAFGAIVVAMLEGRSMECHKCHAKNKRNAKCCANCGKDFDPKLSYR